MKKFEESDLTSPETAAAGLLHDDGSSSGGEAVVRAAVGLPGCSTAPPARIHDNSCDIVLDQGIDFDYFGGIVSLGF